MNSPAWPPARDFPPGALVRTLRGGTSASTVLTLRLRTFWRGADPLRALPHAGEAPVSVTPGLKNLRVDPSPVVAHEHPQLARRGTEGETLDAATF